MTVRAKTQWMAQRIMHTQPGCILHRLASALEPVTCQEVRRLGATSLQGQTLFLDVRGCSAEWMPCDGVMPWGIPPSPQNMSTGLHIVITALRLVWPEPWDGGQDRCSQSASSPWCFSNCSSDSGRVLHLCCSLEKWEHSHGSACAACLYCCSWRMLSSLFCYMWTPHWLALLGTLIKYRSRSVWASGKSLTNPSLG